MFISIFVFDENQKLKNRQKAPRGVGVGRIPQCSARLPSKQRWRMSMVVKFPVRKSALLQFQTLAGYIIYLRSDCSVVLSCYEWF